MLAQPGYRSVTNARALDRDRSALSRDCGLRFFQIRIPGAYGVRLPLPLGPCDDPCCSVKPEGRVNNVAAGSTVETSLN